MVLTTAQGTITGYNDTIYIVYSHLYIQPSRLSVVEKPEHRFWSSGWIAVAPMFCIFFAEQKSVLQYEQLSFRGFGFWIKQKGDMLYLRLFYDVTPRTT